jgi:hypothetical protein
MKVPLLDLLLFKCGRRLDVEIKRMDAPPPRSEDAASGSE